MFASLRGRLPRIGRVPRLLVAATCLLLALASAVGGKARSRQRSSGVPVVVAARDLPAGHRLAARDLAVLYLPRAARPAAARAGPGALTGARLAGPVTAREPITPAELVGASLASGLGRGLLAAPVAVGDPHVVDLIRRGDRIDLLEAARPPDVLDAAPSALSTRVDTVARASLVLAVLPEQDSAGAELIIATDRRTASRITRDSASHVFTPVVVPP
jgi:Flp pilus assembly protein CpaB